MTVLDQNLSDSGDHTFKRLNSRRVPQFKENPLIFDERWKALTKNLVDAASIWVQRINDGKAAEKMKEDRDINAKGSNLTL